MADYDVLVIGAGPAGSSAAIQCLQAGLSVSIIERSSFPRERPGETLHPGVESLLRHLGVLGSVLKAGCLRHEGNWVRWNGNSRFVPFGKDESGPWLGYQVWGAELDEILLARARQLDAAIVQPCRAIRPIVKDNHVVGLVTSEGILRARWVIDAGGGQHWLATKLNLGLERYSPLMIAHYGYAEGSCSQRDNAPLITGDHSGWTWTARVCPGVYQWTRLTWEMEDLDKDWLPPEFAGLASRGCARGANVTWRIVNEAAGSGYFLAGDSAAVLDPASSHGILKAIVSGIMAGHAITNIVGSRQSQEQAVVGYNKWLTDWYRNDISNLKRFYMELPSHPAWLDRSIEKLRNFA